MIHIQYMSPCWTRLVRSLTIEPLLIFKPLKDQNRILLWPTSRQFWRRGNSNIHKSDRTEYRFQMTNNKCQKSFQTFLIPTFSNQHYLAKSQPWQGSIRMGWLHLCRLVYFKLGNGSVSDHLVAKGICRRTERRKRQGSS